MVRDLGELGINMQKIISRLMANKNLVKLLYYTDKDPLAGQDLTEAQLKDEVYEKLIKIVPRFGPKETSHSIISMRVVRGRGIATNDQFQTIQFNFEVLVPLTQWFIKDSNLRPFCIMSEILKSLNGKVINGLGKLEGGDFSINFITDEASSYEMEFYLTDYE